MATESATQSQGVIPAISMTMQVLSVIAISEGFPQ